MLLFLFYLSTRLFRIGLVPKGIQIDELGSAFDAQAIAHFGVDRYLTKLPPYFKNYGGGQNALYTYSGALLFLFTDFTLAKFRLVAVAYGIAGFFCLYFLSKSVFRDTRTALAGCFLYTVLPVFIMSQRWGLESYLLLSMSFIASYSFVLAYEKEKALWYALSGFLWGITLYTYAITYIIVPLFLTLMLVYMLWLRKLSLKQAFSFSLPLVLLAAPLVLEQMVNKGLVSPCHILWSDFLPMEWYRGNEFSFKNIWRNIPDLWILFSHDSLHHNASPAFGTLYYISLPFIAAGLVLCCRQAFISLKERRFDFSILLLAYTACSLFTTLFMLEININRSNELYFSFLLFIVYSFHWILRKNKWILAGLLAVYLIFFLFFSNFYFRGEYNRTLAEGDLAFLFQPDDLGRAVKRMEDQFGEDKKIIIMANEAVDHHFQVAAYAGTSPYDYHAEDESSWIEEKNYAIGVPEELDLSGQSVYVIGSELHHITDYLVSCGFQADDVSVDRYSLVYK